MGGADHALCMCIYNCALYCPFGDNMKANFQIDRPAYHVSLDTVVNSCTIPLDGESSCSLSVPMSSEYTAIMSLEAGSIPLL